MNGLNIRLEDTERINHHWKLVRIDIRYNNAIRKNEISFGQIKEIFSRPEQSPEYIKPNPPKTILTSRRLAVIVEVLIKGAKDDTTKEGRRHCN